MKLAVVLARERAKLARYLGRAYVLRNPCHLCMDLGMRPFRLCEHREPEIVAAEIFAAAAAAEAGRNS